MNSRLRAMIDANYARMWRLVRRHGVEEAAIEDALQEVFLVAARRLESIEPGREAAFLFGVALRVASKMRRKRAASADRVPDGEFELEHSDEDAPSPDDALDDRRARELLDDALDAMSPDLRTVLVLHELEGMDLRRIAELLEIPVATAGSRFRRAREQFDTVARRLRARLRFTGEMP
jgi:RNA polymerase sigma-70 factor, ECF subfamily